VALLRALLHCATGPLRRPPRTRRDARSSPVHLEVAMPVANSLAARSLALDADRIRATWLGWDKGKPSAHSPVFVLERRKA
jgi:hypothetical protein